MPHTKIGKWSVGLVSAFIVVLLVFYVLVATGPRGDGTFFGTLSLVIPLILAGACGIAGLVTGLIAIIKKRERAALVYFAVVIGTLVTLFTAAEFIFPH